MFVIIYWYLLKFSVVASVGLGIATMLFFLAKSIDLILVSSCRVKTACKALLNFEKIEKLYFKALKEVPSTGVSETLKSEWEDLCQAKH